MATITSPRIGPGSGASTPTASSVRTSLDTNRTSSPSRLANTITTTSTGGGGGGTARRNRADRAALRDYYNLKPAAPGSAGRGSSVGAASSTTAETEDEQQSQQEGGRASSEETDEATGAGVPSELDRPGFDAAGYVARLLATAGLAGVLRAEGALLEEMRELDGERKALVYDNYSKLIAATDTIRGMRKNIEAPTTTEKGVVAGLSGGRAGAAAGGGGGPATGGVGRAEDLKDMVGRIVDAARSLAGTAEREKGEVKEMVLEGKGAEEAEEERARRQRKRDTVLWVVQSPRRWRGYVDKGQGEKAGEEWVDVKRLLEKWKGTEGVEEVRKACEEIVAEQAAAAASKRAQEEQEEQESGSDSD